MSWDVILMSVPPRNQNLFGNAGRFLINARSRIGHPPAAQTSFAIARSDRSDLGRNGPARNSTDCYADKGLLPVV